jgi:hypothetical protein
MLHVFPINRVKLVAKNRKWQILKLGQREYFRCFQKERAPHGTTFFWIFELKLETIASDTPCRFLVWTEISEALLRYPFGLESLQIQLHASMRL